MIPVGYGQITCSYEIANTEGTAVTTFGFVNLPESDAGTVGDTFKSAVTASGLMAELSASLDFTEVLVKLGPDATGESAIVDIGLTGSNGGQPVSPQVAMLISKNTALGGRRGRGRIFMPGLPASSLDNSGTWAAGQPSDMADDWQEIWDAMAFVGYSHVLLHSNALTPTPVTSLVGQSRVATQRRRARR